MSSRAPQESSPPSSSDPSRPPATVRPRPPRWRPWVLLVGVLVTALLLFRPATSTTTPTKLNFTQFSSDVTANQVKTATISTTGAVRGTLSNGTSYTSQIPTALQDSTLATTLQQHNVQVTGTGASSGITVGTVILDLLPLALFFGFFVWLGRRSQKALGGVGGIMGVG